MGPEESMQIQSHLASTIAMAFDECVENPAEHSYSKASCDRTVRWLERCVAEQKRLNGLEETINKHQMLFGINQGCTYEDLRIEHMKRIREMEYCSGFAIGGLAVGEPTEVMYNIIEKVEPFMPKDKPRYLMGVGTPTNIIEAVYRGVDFFDCVMPSRNARHGTLFTWNGIMHITNKGMKLTLDLLTSIAIALLAVITAGHIFVICSSLRSSWAAGWQLCTICISTTRSRRR